VFEDAFRAMCGLLQSDHRGPAQTQEVQLSAADGAALLADWVGELAYLAESEGLVPERLDRLDVGESDLSATVVGFTSEPPHLVKAATYHRLSLERTPDGWRATVVLDV
jgi:SHS2 domain-containing protein